jgi:hypothetical protein
MDKKNIDYYIKISKKLKKFDFILKEDTKDILYLFSAYSTFIYFEDIVFNRIVFN